MTTLNETSTSQRTRSAADSIHRGIDHAAEALHDTTESAAASAVKLAVRADNGVEKLREQQRIARENTVEYTEKHPLRAIVISLGVGFLLAKLARTRSARSMH